MNIEVAGIKIVFGTVSELQEALKKKVAQLDREIEEHETKASSLRKARKEMQKAIGSHTDTAKPTHGGASGA
jgi:phage shock protein A